MGAGTQTIPAVVDHTFTTGRTFRIRSALPMMVITANALREEEESIAAGFDAMADEDSPAIEVSSGLVGGMLQRTVEAMFIRPAVKWQTEYDLGIDPEVQWETPDEAPEVISAYMLHDAEISEVMRIARSGLQEARRFRGDGGGAPDREGREGLEQGPERSRSGTARKRAAREVGASGAGAG